MSGGALNALKGTSIVSIRLYTVSRSPSDAFPHQLLLPIYHNAGMAVNAGPEAITEVTLNATTYVYLRDRSLQSLLTGLTVQHICENTNVARGRAQAGSTS